MRRLSLLLATVVVLASCNKPATDSSTILQTDTVHPIMKTNDELVDPIHGTETSFSYGALSGVDGNNANGVGYRYSFSDGSTVITLNLNIPIVKESYYIGWLVQDGGNKDPIKMGDFFTPFNDARHGLKYESKTDLSRYKNVIVTQELSQNPITPGAVVATGSLTIVKPPVPLKMPVSSSSAVSAKL